MEDVALSLSINHGLKHLARFHERVAMWPVLSEGAACQSLRRIDHPPSYIKQKNRVSFMPPVTSHHLKAPHGFFLRRLPKSTRKGESAHSSLCCFLCFTVFDFVHKEPLGTCFFWVVLLLDHTGPYSFPFSLCTPQPCQVAGEVVVKPS